MRAQAQELAEYRAGAGQLRPCRDPQPCPARGCAVLLSRQEDRLRGCEPDAHARDLRGGDEGRSRDRRRRCGPISRPPSSAIRPAIPIFRPSSSSRASMRCNATAWRIGCGIRTAIRSPISSRAGCRSCSRVDIHPAAQIGRGIMMDHATGIVIGETAVVGDDVSMHARRDAWRHRQGDAATVIPRCAAACCCRWAPRCWAISRSANTAASAPAAWCCSPFRPTARSPACRRR